MSDDEERHKRRERSPAEDIEPAAARRRVEEAGRDMEQPEGGPTNGTSDGKQQPAAGHSDGEGKEAEHGRRKRSRSSSRDSGGKGRGRHGSRDRSRSRSRSRSRDRRHTPDRHHRRDNSRERRYRDDSRDERHYRDGGSREGRYKEDSSRYHGDTGRQPSRYHSSSYDRYRDADRGYDRGGGDRGGRGYGHHSGRDHRGGEGGGRGGREQQQQEEEGVVRRGRGFAGGAGAGAAAAARQAEEDPAAAAAGGGGEGDAAAAANGTAAAAGEVAPRKAAVAGRAGGAYIPPFKLARMMAEVADKASPEAQRMTWDALRKSLNGLVNKVNAPNLRNILPELFAENLMRGRGLFCQSLMKAQMASPSFTPVYAGLVAVVNTKFPELGELLLHRVINQFKRAYKRNDKQVCMAVTKFLAHLINQGVVHEVLALEMLILMLENPSDDSVEMAVDFCKDVGAFLQEVAPAGLHSVFERFRTILHEGAIDKRVQYIIEGLFAIRKAGFEASGHPAVRKELDLVEDEDQITHEMSLEEKHDPQATLNVFKVDPEYELHEQQYLAIKKEILGEEEEEEGGGGSGSEGGSGSDGSEESSEESSEEEDAEAAERQEAIDDETQTNLVNLRRTIYLTIMSSLDFEEAGHKLMKINLLPGQEREIPIMIIECCSQERTYNKYYGLLGARFCMLRKEFQATFEECFQQQYAVIHNLETNKLRNVSKLFANLLVADGISWGVLGCVRITEDDTTSASRIFVKYLFQEISEHMGLVKLNQRLGEPSLAPYLAGLFPDDSMANMRFAINFFTSIGLGGITDKYREYYKELPKILAAKREAEDRARAAAMAAAGGGGSSSSDDSSSSSGSDSSSSSSGSDSSSSSSSDSSSSDDSDSDSGDRRRRKRRR